MQTIDIYEMTSKVKNAFSVLDSLSPSSEEDGQYEEGLYQLEKAKECFRFMSSSLEDIICEAKVAQKALDSIGGIIQQKLDNPYLQIDFVSFQSRLRHAYA